MYAVGNDNPNPTRAAANAPPSTGDRLLLLPCGGRGARQGILVALVENTSLWPAMLVLDRVHPARRDGTWPPLFANPRVFGQATAGHALFGAVVGALVRRGR